LPQPHRPLTLRNPIKRMARTRIPNGPPTGRPWLLLVLLWSGAVAGLPARAAADFGRLMNVGKAQLENRNSAKAIESFTAALKLEPHSAAALRNLARAHLLANEDEAALKLLERARPLEKDSAATSYLAGLACAHRSQFEQAVLFLEEAVRLDAFTPALRFQLANACQKAGQHEKAITQLRETVRLDPLHASAHFKLAAYASQAGDQAEFERRQQEFARLRKLFGDESRTPTALERCVYTQPEAAPGPAPRPRPGIKVQFSDATREVFTDEASRAATAAEVIDVGANGAISLFVVDAQGAAGLLTLGANGKFARTPVTPALGGRRVFEQCIAGDFFDDIPKGAKYDPELHAVNDVFLVGRNGVCLLKRTGPASFEDVTERAGLSGVSGRRAQWVDYDHDGDLDLVIATEAGLQLWQNNGNATFTNVTKQVGLDGATAATDIAAVDFDSNVAVDLMAARGGLPTLVFMNQRAGQFARMPEPPGPWPPARRVLADDLDNDGNPDALLLAEKQAVVLFGRRAERKQLELASLQAPVAAFVDFDNDGWLDVCIAGAKSGENAKGALRLWRNEGAGDWPEVTSAAGLGSLDLPPVGEIIPADFDNDGDTDLMLITADGRLRFLRNNGGNANGQLKLRIVGTKTNPTGLGTRVEVRATEFRAARSVSTVPVEIGVGQSKQLDSVQTVWGNGVVENRIEVAVKPAPLTIVEKNVAAGSCPYLYAWDGRRFRFVTDLLGNSPLGLSLRRGLVLPADPDEFVVVGTDKNFRPRRGFYELEVTEELREVLYLDSARLVAVDHAPDVEMHSTDKLGSPPFPPSELWALRSPKLPVRALGDDGIDRTEALRAIDGVFAPPGPPRPPPLRGVCQPLALTLDFGPLDTSRPLVLALTGWIQYGDASVNIASSQNASLAVIPPKIEAETADGAWQPVEVAVGMPAGKIKTILCDLTGKLPRMLSGRLRLTTTFELRWDRIALFERGDVVDVHQHELPPHAANLRWRGFSEIKSRAPGHPQTPAYEKVSQRPPWRTTPQGWCTRYGDVLELVKARDDRLVLVNAGDALTLRFDARSLPAVPKGRVRTFFFCSVGWDKDADHNVVAGDTVEPLPVGAGADWCLEFNTRWVPGGRFAEP
jgi:Flp pilus assembly protein TadD